MDFLKLKNAVAQQFAKMSKHTLFYTAVEKDALWITYIDSFPAGSNPTYRNRTDHDCSCCKDFVRTLGNVVAVIDNQITSIWDFTAEVDPNYRVVADAMAALVKSQPIENLFLHVENKVGTEKTFEQLNAEANASTATITSQKTLAEAATAKDSKIKVKTWDHFFCMLPSKVVVKGEKIGPLQSDERGLHDVFDRSLRELTEDSIDTVSELIAQNSLYRGEEHNFAITEFKKLQKQYKKVPAAQRDFFVWNNVHAAPPSVIKIRGTSIGTLLVDLSGTPATSTKAAVPPKELEDAVGAYESVVAPQNYKRSASIVTKKQVDQAREKIDELGYTSALKRRFAMVGDITFSNIIYANQDARKAMDADVFDSIGTKSDKPKNLSKIEEVTIDKFIADIVPRASSIEVMFENRHQNNLVSLITAEDETAKGMFKWDNPFSWSYNGDVTDSIKEKVKKAGGNVTGDLCCRLAWYNHDDLDFHMLEPKGGHISYRTRHLVSPAGGQLDVDANAGSGTTREPVENIFYGNRKKMLEGRYRLYVHQYSKRETTNIGFDAEIDYCGEVLHFSYDKAVASEVTVAEFDYTNKGGFKIVSSLPSSTRSKTIWGINTNEFQKVNVMMFSPNHWDGHGVGNKHYFFMLQDCKNEGKARGFYNEFLKEELNPHRKVLEIVGSKMRTDESDNQLSGLGFSSTQKSELLVRVKGTFSRTVKVIF